MEKVKHKHWSGFPAIFGLEGAPALYLAGCVL
jgi:hypothetical protein